MVKRNLPQGRGYRTGPDAHVNQNESFAIRQELLPRQQGLRISPSDLDVQGFFANRSPPVLGKPVLLRCKPLYYDFNLTAAQIVVGTGAASASIQTAIYTYKDRKFTMVPGSQCSLSGASSATVVEKVQCELQAGTEYWIAAVALGNTTPLYSSVTKEADGPKKIEFYNLSSQDITDYFTGGLGNVNGPYAGKAICNGSNGTPNIANRFIRAVTGAAGTTGGSDSSAHTHAIDHDHGSFNSGSESAHTHSGTGLFANIEINSTEIVAETSTSAPDFTWNETATATGFTAGATTGAETAGVVVSGTTGAGSSHLHTVDPPAFTGTSGAASATDNKPAYVELTALMTVGTSVNSLEVLHMDSTVAALPAEIPVNMITTTAFPSVVSVWYYTENGKELYQV